MKKIRVLLADDHSVVRSGLRSLFKTTHEFSVVGEASNGEDAVRMAIRLKPDVVILDISMPKMGGIEATRLIKLKSPETGVLILTIHSTEEYIYEMVRAGANGYVLKDAEKQQIFAAVKAV
ncbi:MAG TPA: response regulator transcription factor, partial [Bacteroidota bacterium]